MRKNKKLELFYEKITEEYNEYVFERKTLKSKEESDAYMNKLIEYEKTIELTNK